MKSEEPRYRCCFSPFTFHFSLDNKGMALLMTILIVALLSMLIIDIHSRSYLAYARAKNSVNSLNAYYIMRSGASAAMGFLERDAKESRIDALSEDWAQGVRNFPVGEGTVSVEITDEASKFNINTLVSTHGTIDADAVERFGRLLKGLGIDETLASRTASWLKDNRREYAFRDISELFLIPEFTSEAFKKIENLITVHTVRGNNNININTVGREILGILSPVLTESLITAIIDYRKEHPLNEIGDLKKVQGIDDAVLLNFSKFITVNSSRFAVHVKAEVSDTVRKGVAVVDRTGSSVRVISWKEE